MIYIMRYNVYIWYDKKKIDSESRRKEIVEIKNLKSIIYFYILL